MRGSSVKRLLGGRAHVQPRKGTHDEARNYVRKSDTTYYGPGCLSGYQSPGEFGEPISEPGMGFRSDLASLRVAVQCPNVDLKALSTEYFDNYIKYSKGIKEVVELHETHRTSQTKLLVFYGPGGTGKSYSADRYDTPDNTYHLSRPNGSTVWWDGYNGQKTVVIDEFEGWIYPSQFKTWVSESPCLVPIKGGFKKLKAETIIIVTNQHPRRWWKAFHDDMFDSAIERRLSPPIGFCYRYRAVGVREGPVKMNTMNYRDSVVETWADGEEWVAPVRYM